MDPITLALAGSALLSGLFSSSAANNAADAQQDSAAQQLALQESIYNQQTELFAPYYQSGLTANNALNYEMGLGAKPQGYGGFQASPGYQFSLDQGVAAIDGSAASQGNLFSGATLKAQQEYGTGLANQAYGNYINRLMGQASTGQAAAGQTASAGANYAQGGTNALAQSGNAQSAGYIGSANALTGTVDNLASTYGYMSQQPNAPTWMV